MEATDVRSGPKLGLLWQVLIAIIAGIALGFVFPDWLTRVFVTINMLFSQFLGFFIPLIILGLITPAIADLGRGAGKWLAVTAAIAYGSTIVAGFLGWGASTLVLPRVLPDSGVKELTNPDKALLEPYFQLQIPPVLGVMSALVLAFILGVAITMIKGDLTIRGMHEFREIVNIVISNIIVPFLPVYIFGIFLNMTQGGQVASVIATFLGVVVFVFVLTWLMLLMQYGIAGAVTGKNPFRMLGTMLPAYVTALGTASSAATIPVTLRQAIAMGVRKEVASFTVPLCATIHLAGSMIKITSFSLAVMMIYDMEIGVGLIAGFIFLLGVMMIAAPGVPGGAIVTATALLSSMLGFTEAQVGLMIATYIAIDSFGTATNVTGDGAISAIIDKLSRGEHNLPTEDNTTA
ncbi:dicarboxylate/amino acid:cation symporter [Tessaracoccus sp. OH4464_COT-324]|uniref:dicarboxylate/amino acid:cation symporter n=1 Tax=Tessaracoccus sp. OH4464_COT-324 TaxID=2491059 RepID=UPI000F62DAD4|nr:dicarboxylate/amino acid:cation symporter [Tessaracoccus sp. OH4464_COT-324]RRD45297.1 dicarboxylate/amino acid:cation symporter [Tessaracoccus sp. OH4464_COT-324]